MAQKAKARKPPKRTATRTTSKTAASGPARGNTPKPIPAGFHSVTPYLNVQGAANAIGFYARAFGATELMRMPGPGGKLMHAEIKVGDSVVMLSDEFIEMGGGRSPQSLGGTTGYLFVYVPDVDAVFRRAVDAGARVEMPLTNMFWGDRFGKVVDPFGHVWALATHQEDVPPAEIGKRAQAAMSTGQGASAGHA
jgi:PhnB protein